MKHLHHLYDYMIVASVFAIWAAIKLPESMETILGYFLVLTVGIGHGANDIAINYRHKKRNTIQTLLFIAVYALIVLLGFGAFFVIPDLILALFIVVSGYHFGEEHLERFAIEKAALKPYLYTSYGLSIILGLLYLKSQRSLPVINELVILDITQTHLLYSLFISMLLTIVLAAWLLNKVPAALLIREVFYLLVIALIFKISSLVWGFAIYFILWHSVPSILHQVHYLHETVNRKTILKYIKSSVLYWIAALVFLSVLYYFLSDKTALFLSVIVAFLGGITFPHVFVMHKLHK